MIELADMTPSQFRHYTGRKSNAETEVLRYLMCDVMRLLGHQKANPNHYETFRFIPKISIKELKEML